MYHQDWCFLAVQGPESVQVMRELFPEAGDLGVHAVRRGRVPTAPGHRHPIGIHREVGFELFTYQDIARDLWTT